MRNFEILRYIKKYSVLIFLFALVGAVGIYWYGNKSQTYTAKVTIKYADSNAEKGLTPDGRALDVTEIYSSKVVASVIDDLHLNTTIDYIRGGCSVKQIIPDDQKTINAALADAGKTSDYFPTEYTVSFSVGGTKSTEYARNILDSLIKNYCIFFSEKYVEQSVLPNGIADSSIRNYDYLSCVTVLEKSTDEMLSYLSEKNNAYPEYRSSTTGYSYGDLVDIYTFIQDYQIPELYALIMADTSPSDRELLISNLNGEYNRYSQIIASYDTQLEKLKALMDNLVDKNAKIQSDQLAASSKNGSNGVNNANISSDYILNDVEASMGSSMLTQYESLLKEYVDIQIDREATIIDQAHTAYLLSVYENIQVDTETDSSIIDEAIDRLIANLNQYYDIVSLTSTELNSYRSAKNLKTLTSITAGAKINIKMYIVLAAAFFLIVGVVVAVLLGRTSDFIEYFKFIDEMTGLPNRQRCDDVIGEYSEALLENDFASVAIRLNNLSYISEKSGREAGNSYLKDFANILKKFSELYGFIGYNGGGQFIGFFERCNARKLAAILKALDNAVVDYNEHHEHSFIEYSVGSAVSSEVDVYEIRDLLRLAITDTKGKKTSIKDVGTDKTEEKTSKKSPDVIETREETVSASGTIEVPEVGKEPSDDLDALWGNCSEEEDSSEPEEPAPEDDNTKEAETSAKVAGPKGRYRFIRPAAKVFKRNGLRIR